MSVVLATAVTSLVTPLPLPAVQPFHQSTHLSDGVGTDVFHPPKV